MSQICSAPFCRHNVQHQPAVNRTNQYHVSYIFPSNFPNHLQTLHHSTQQYSGPPSRPLDPRTIAMAQHANANTTWAAAAPPSNDQDEKTQYAPMLHHPQPEHPFQRNYFSECMDYRPEEATLFNPTLNYPGYNQCPRPLHTLTMPYNPTNQTSATNKTEGVTSKQEEGPAMSLSLVTNVDTAEYDIVSPNDWHTASVDLGVDSDDDALSPAFTEANSHGPITPISSDGDTGFSDVAIRRISQELSSSFGSSSSEIFRDMDSSFDFNPRQTVAPNPHENPQCNNQFSNNYAGLQYPISNTTGYQGPKIPAIPDYHSATRFRDSNGFPSTAPLTSAPPQQCSSISPNTTIASSRSSKTSATDANTDTDSAERRRRDKYLLDMREQGYSYKVIKHRGGFFEAESTLRGRVRVLTKDKSERVRKPSWTADDVHLLRRAVQHHKKQREQGAYVRQRAAKKIPWKLVSVFMKEHGSSYPFAAATCAKKFEEVGMR